MSVLFLKKYRVLTDIYTCSALTGDDAMLVSIPGEPFVVLSMPVKEAAGESTRILLLYGTPLMGELDAQKQTAWNEMLAKAGAPKEESADALKPEG